MIFTTIKEMVIVDIQPAKDFSRQHFAGALEINAFPEGGRRG